MNTESRINYSCWNVEPLSNGPVSMGILYKNLVEWAVLAASSHNVQPWKFIINLPENSIGICVDPQGILPASDVKGRQAYISVGCAAQNLMLAALYYNLQYKIEYHGEAIYPLPTIIFKFKEITELNSGDAHYINAMKNRRMNRSKFDPVRQVPENILIEMSDYAKSLGSTLHIVKDVTTRSAVAEFQYLADRAVIAITKFRNELADYLLPNDTRQGTGMPGNTFGLSDEVSSYVHEELKKKDSFDSDLAVGFASSSRDGIRNSPVLCAITAPEDTPMWWVKVGMAFQRIALTAEMAGLAISVHAALVEVDMFNRLLRLRLGTTARPTMIFRIGYSTEERPHSPRVLAADVCEEA